MTSLTTGGAKGCDKAGHGGLLGVRSAVDTVYHAPMVPSGHPPHCALPAGVPMLVPRNFLGAYSYFRRAHVVLLQPDGQVATMQVWSKGVREDTAVSIGPAT